MFHHLDWVAGFLSMAGMYLVGKKKWYGWIVNLAALFFYLYFNVVLHLWGIVPVNLIMLLMFLANARDWRKDKNE